jgi:hypothetical protein
MEEYNSEYLESQAKMEDVFDDLWLENQKDHKSPIWTALLGIAILLLVGILDNWLLERFFKITYLEWYLKNGTFIGLVSSFVTLSWGDINKNVRLISDHPLRYLSACSGMIAVTFSSIAADYSKPEDPSNLPTKNDFLISIIFYIVLTCLIFGWLILIVPLQYVVFLICGAPARLHLKSEMRGIARQRKTGFLKTAEQKKSNKVPKGWWDVSLFAKPISTTGLIAAFVFYILRIFLV